MIVASESVTLRCSCCASPWATIQNGVFVVISHHHGNKHVNALKLEDVQRLLDEARMQELSARQPV